MINEQTKHLKQSEILQKILAIPGYADRRTEFGEIAAALYAAANVLPDGHEKTALLYLGKNNAANIILHNGDKVINNALRTAIPILEKKESASK